MDVKTATVHINATCRSFADWRFVLVVGGEWRQLTGATDLASATARARAILAAEWPGIVVDEIPVRESAMLGGRYL